MNKLKKYFKFSYAFTSYKKQVHVKKSLIQFLNVYRPLLFKVHAKKNFKILFLMRIPRFYTKYMHRKVYFNLPMHILRFYMK